MGIPYTRQQNVHNPSHGPVRYLDGYQGIPQARWMVYFTENPIEIDTLW